MARDLKNTAMTASLAAAVLMLAGKTTAYLLTGSAAIFSDAAESVVHMAATGMAAFSLWYASQPPDAQHPYGHGKIAFFSAGFEGALIMVAGLSVVAFGVRALIVGPELKQLGVGLAITGALAAVNLALGLFLVQVGKRHHSVVLVANGQHVLTDMWTSVAVVAGVAIVWMTGVVWLDPIIAILGGANILFAAIALMRGSYQGLMDKADPVKTDAFLARLQEAVDKKWITGFHQLRHRKVNDETWVEVHLLLPGETTTVKAHRIVTRVEVTLRALFPDEKTQITSHVEPSDHDSAHPAGYLEPVDPYVNGAETSPEQAKD